MNPRNTRTGSVLENMVLPSLTQGGYTYQTQARIGFRPHGKRHVADVLAFDRNNDKYIISMKWQQTSGTAEQKVPFEVICLIDAMQSGNYKKAYLVLAGDGWTLKNFYISGGLNSHLVDSHLVTIIGLEAFVGLANSGKL